MSVTMKDVARLAGVSPSTVSRALNESYLVKEETVKKVKKAADELDYRMNESARVLRTNSSKLLGFIGSGMELIFLSEVLKGIEDQAQERDYTILFGDSDGELKKELSYLELMSRKQVEGIILNSANIARELLEEIRNLEIPVVFLSADIPEADVYCVTVNSLAASYDVIEYLIESGHQHIGIIRGPSSDLVSSGERMKGVRLAFNHFDHEFNTGMVVKGNFSLKSGYKGAQQLMEQNEGLDAIFAFNDEMAIGAIKAINDLGMEIPLDMSVVGFDNINMAEYLPTSLTTINQSGYEVGSRSVDILYGLINGEEQQKTTYIPHELVLRDSTCARRQ